MTFCWNWGDPGYPFSDSPRRSIWTAFRWIWSSCHHVMFMIYPDQAVASTCLKGWWADGLLCDVFFKQRSHLGVHRRMNGEGVLRIASIMVIVCTSYPGCPNTQEMAYQKSSFSKAGRLEIPWGLQSWDLPKVLRGSAGGLLFSRAKQGDPMSSHSPWRGGSEKMLNDLFQGPPHFKKLK